MQVNKIKYILFTLLNILCVFMLMSFLLISMTLRYYIKADTVFQAVQSIIPESSGIPVNLNLPVRLLFRILEPLIYKGKAGVFLKVMTSVWIQPVLILLMIGILIRSVKLHIAENQKSGTPFIIFSVTACIPSTVAFISGLMITKAITFLNLPDHLESVLQGKMVFHSGISMLICMILFCFGTVWNKKIKS